MSSDHSDRGIIRFFFLLSNQTSLYCWIYWKMRWTFLFYFWRYLTVTCHNLSHFNSRLFILDFTWNCCWLQEATKFLSNPGQFKCVTRETRYHVYIKELLIRSPWSQVAELVQRPWTMLKILYFSGARQFFHVSLYDRGRKLII